MTPAQSTDAGLRVGAEDRELAARLSEELTAFNNEATGAHDEASLSVRATDAAGDLVGGLVGWTWGGCGGVNELWVRADRRHEGWGSRLMRAAEDEARARGCTRMIVSSMSFQAPDFYRCHGYVETGRTEGLPGGAADHHFWKALHGTESAEGSRATSHDALIAAAQAVLHPHTVGDRLFGDVGAALVTPAGNRYSGVCIDTGSGTGFCAEHAAIAAMVTAGEYRISTIVAVWRNEEGALHVLPPCGRCREFVRQVDPANLDTEVVLGRDSSAPLRDLLPHHEWPAPLG